MFSVFYPSLVTAVQDETHSVRELAAMSGSMRKVIRHRFLEDVLGNEHESAIKQRKVDIIMGAARHIDEYTLKASASLSPLFFYVVSLFPAFSLFSLNSFVLFVLFVFLSFPYFLCCLCFPLFYVFFFFVFLCVFFVFVVCIIYFSLCSVFSFVVFVFICCCLFFLFVCFLCFL